MKEVMEETNMFKLISNDDTQLYFKKVAAGTVYDCRSVNQLSKLKFQDNNSKYDC